MMMTKSMRDFGTKGSTKTKALSLESSKAAALMAVAIDNNKVKVVAFIG